MGHPPVDYEYLVHAALNGVDTAFGFRDHSAGDDALFDKLRHFADFKDRDERVGIGGIGEKPGVSVIRIRPSAPSAPAMRAAAVSAFML